jgi:hypothetical protein
VRATDSLVSKVCSKINNDKITNLAAEQGWKVTQTWPPMLSAHYRPYGSGHAPSIVAHPGIHDRNIELLALFRNLAAEASGVNSDPLAELLVRPNVPNSKRSPRPSGCQNTKFGKWGRSPSSGLSLHFMDW